MDVQALVGWNVARLRSKLRISQGELATLATIIDQSYISGLETGKRNPTAVVLMLISSALGVQVGELFSTIGAPREIVDGPVEIRSSRSRKQ
jgi:transcriptional regulator with XRE-family HTH domain